jgi:predicted metal-dependent HD superfamily phosphohydrolase
MDIPWTELTAVGVRTTDDGPFEEDIFWLFVTPHETIEVPGSLIDGAVFEKIAEHLPGFAYGKVTAAATRVHERQWRVWHREDSRYAPSKAELAARFAALIARLGGTGSTFDALYSQWNAEPRRYHNVEHLVDCLREVDRAGGNDIVELALWYHDAIYDASARDNEARSAELLLADAKTLGIDATRAAELVLATAHGSVEPASAPDVDLLLDIDLSILGRDELRFLDFDYGVAEEYAHLPPDAFRAGRAKFLASMLTRPTLFRTAFRERYEASARANISALLASPRYRS